MPYMYDKLNELKVSGGPTLNIKDLQGFFNETLAQVFQEQYLKKQDL